jgi:hypothetical protein
MRSIMDKVGFAKKWTNLITECVTSVSFRVKMNERALTKGPFIHISVPALCEGLLSFVEQIEGEGQILGVTEPPNLYKFKYDCPHLTR